MTFDPQIPVALILLGAALAVAGCVWLLVTGPQPGRRLSWALRLAAVLLLTAAMLRPGVPGEPGEELASDADVFLLVDTTASMGATDWDGEARLDGVRADIDALVRELPGARYSLITFDTEAVTRMPLSTDTTALASALELMEPEYALYSRGSSPWAAAGYLRERLEAAGDRHPDAARLVFYFGDGEATAHEPVAGFGEAAELVHGGAVFGYGSAGGATMPRNDPFPSAAEELIRDPATGEPAVSVPDPGTLDAIAAELGVASTMREPGTAIGEVAAGLALTQLAVPDGRERRTEMHWLPLAGLLAVLTADALLVAARLRILRRAERAAS
ncbi:vWA domain-containing protein [Sediminivirga luteola]|uniref:VWFA domain-containing protein n=1 Tax=Sediminivirga luteola TaxID=1774748 RepID=A0A8J2TYF1_9MICO|nr:vWA domain-containing protein [Sediminivirga luteola]GGA15180.1 hypothetical protein GCM10011333_17790 [Sediminivirga luteola]